jgi:hypothetical protein
VIEWITVRATATPDSYRVVYDNRDLFVVHAVNQDQLIEAATKEWRAMFSNSP